MRKVKSFMVYVDLICVQKSDCVTSTKEIPSRVMGSICTRRQKRSYISSEALSQDLQDLMGVSGMYGNCLEINTGLQGLLIEWNSCPYVDNY